MSAAPVDIAPPPLPPAEPVTLRDLYAQAKADLAKPSPEAHLRWIFWHARAVGRLELARMGLRRVEQRDYEAHVRGMAALPSETMKAAWDQQKPHVTEMHGAEECVLERVAFVEAAGRVCNLFDGMWGRDQK